MLRELWQASAQLLTLEASSLGLRLNPKPYNPKPCIRVMGGKVAQKPLNLGVSWLTMGIQKPSCEFISLRPQKWNHIESSIQQLAPQTCHRVSGVNSNIEKLLPPIPISAKSHVKEHSPDAQQNEPASTSGNYRVYKLSVAAFFASLSAHWCSLGKRAAAQPS